MINPDVDRRVPLLRILRLPHPLGGGQGSRRGLAGVKQRVGGLLLEPLVSGVGKFGVHI